MEIARKAKDSISTHEEPMMVARQKLTITTGMFHVSWILAWLNRSYRCPWLAGNSM